MTMTVKPKRRYTKLTVDRVDVVDRGANFDPASNDGSHILIMKRDVPAADDPVAVIRGRIEKSVRDALANVQKGGADMSIVTVEKFESRGQQYASASYDDERAAAERALIKDAAAIAKRDGVPLWQPIEAALFGVAQDIQLRDPKLSRSAAVVKATQIRPDLARAARTARRDASAALANE